MYSYSLHGLRFEVDAGWPGATKGTVPVDVRVVRGDLPVAPAWIQTGWHIEGTWDNTLVYWRETGPFRVVNGREIRLAPPADADPAALADSLLGRLAGFILVQRDLGALHASAAVVDGEALVFLGEPGSGKSTLVAALVQQGAEFVADDVLRVDFARERPQAIPSYPRLKLAPDNWRAVGVAPAGLPVAFRGSPKRAWTPPRFAHGPAPVRATYLLASGPEYRVERLPAAAALLALLGHSFAGYLSSGYGFDFLGTPERQAAHFQRQARLQATVPVYQLTRPPGVLDVDRLLKRLGR